MYQRFERVDSGRDIFGGYPLDHVVLAVMSARVFGCDTALTHSSCAVQHDHLDPLAPPGSLLMEISVQMSKECLSADDVRVVGGESGNATTLDLASAEYVDLTVPTAS